MEIEELWKLVNAKAQRQKAEKTELTQYRQDWERLKSLLPKPGEILSPQELADLLRRLREVLR